MKSSPRKSEKLYGVWKTMRQRCRDKNKEHYDRYGGRGIRVCEEWGDYLKFKEWAIKNGYKNGLTIDRINTDGGYPRKIVDGYLGKCNKTTEAAITKLQFVEKLTQSQNGQE